MPKHSHDDAHIALLFEGSIENFSSRNANVVSASDLLFIPAGETHTSRYHDNVHAFYGHFRPAWWERVQQDMPSLGITHAFRNSLPAWLAIRLHREFQKCDNLTPFMLEGLTLELLVTMSRNVDNFTESRPSNVPRWLHHVREYLHAHFRESLAVNIVADAAGVHPSHLMRGFRRHYRCTIGDYVRRLRIEHACDLLAMPETGQSLAQVALSLGFADQSHFCKAFKQRTGMTPGEFRNRLGYASLTQKELF